MVVGQDQNQRQFFHGGLVERLMKRAGGTGAVADARRADGSGDALHAARKQSAIDNGNHRAEMADHRQITLLRPAPVDIAVATAHRAERRAEIRARGVEHGFTERQPPRRVTDQRREDVALFEGQTGRDAQRLLSASEKNAAMDFPGAVKRGELVVQQARQQHEAIRGQMCVAPSGSIAHRFRVEHRLQHGGILSSPSRGSNVSFKIWGGNMKKKQIGQLRN